MSTTISEHQARVYEYAKLRGDQWFTSMELSVDTNIPANSAKSHAARFEEIGIFERIRISPAHAFRLDPAAQRHAPKLVDRLEEAVRIFASRRLDWLKREEQVVRHLDAQMERVTVARAVPQLAPAAPQSPVANGERVFQQAPPGGTKTSDPKPEVRRGGSKAELVISMISRPEGASLDELVEASATLPHSVRATISVKTRERGLKAVLRDGRYYIDKISEVEPSPLSA
jgi:hypothetical protein